MRVITRNKSDNVEHRGSEIDAVRGPLQEGSREVQREARAARVMKVSE